MRRLPCPESAEIFAEQGYDWLILDTEHGPFDILMAQRMLQAVGKRCPCVVRVPSNEEIYCSNAEDAKMRPEQGFTLIGLSTDLNYLGRSAGAALAAVKH